MAEGVFGVANDNGCAISGETGSGSRVACDDTGDADLPLVNTAAKGGVGGAVLHLLLDCSKISKSSRYLFLLRESEDADEGEVGGSTDWKMLPCMPCDNCGNTVFISGRSG